MSRLRLAALSTLVASLPILALQAQGVAGKQATANVHVLSHIPGRLTDLEVEQELSRPYAYVSTGRLGGFNVINLKDPAKAFVMYSWHIENPELHQGSALGPAYLKSKGRYYFAQSYQYAATSPDNDLGAIIFDVTGLPDTTRVKEVARIHTPEIPGGFHEEYAYKHSNGQALLFETTNGHSAYIYDIDKVIAGAGKVGPTAKIPNPDSLSGYRFKGYHDFYVGYDPATKQDKFYGAGYTGYFLWDITDLNNPKLLVTLTGIAGTDIAHTFTPDPTGRYAITEFEYTYAPLRVFDLKPGLDGTVKNINRPIGAWTANWQGLPHNHEVRWPYVFVSTYGDEFQAFNFMDPSNPYTVGYFDTSPGADHVGRTANCQGCVESTFGVDVRNADGLIVTSGSGFWAFKMDGFDGWNGHQWGMPNISSAQDWDNGPDGAPKPSKVS